jgi:hypothetical protein
LFFYSSVQKAAWMSYRSCKMSDRERPLMQSLVAVAQASSLYRDGTASGGVVLWNNPRTGFRFE